jgi:rhamnogalacturonan endolyase
MSKDSKSGSFPYIFHRIYIITWFALIAMVWGSGCGSNRSDSFGDSGTGLAGGLSNAGAGSEARTGVSGNAAAGAGGKIVAGAGGSLVGTSGRSGGSAAGSAGSANVGGTNAAGATGGATQVGTGHYQMENIDRGVVAVKATGGVYVGWRMFGYEYDTTASNVEYNLYRDGTKIATVSDSTNYLDAGGTTTSSYAVTAVIKGTEGAQSPAAKPWAQNYLDVPISPPSGSYSASDASPGDLDGDGQYEIVLKWDPSNALDAASAGTTDPVYIDGIKLDGTRLWRINIGMNIRAGAHDTQMSVYDFDGDGKAEVAFKTAPGTKDGKGNYLKTGPAAGADNTKDYRGSRGMALGGPEWLTVFSGTTGEELATVEYPVLYGSSAWGDTNGNRSHRYNGGVSFVSDTGSGKTATGRPSIIQQRGYYTRLTISALNFRDGVLKKIWTYDSGATAGKEAYGKGNHSLMTADVDGDGAMELIPGSSTINSDGTFRCATSNTHGDALHVGVLIKGKGFFVYMPHESEGGHDAHSADTCAFNFNTSGSSDVGRGVAEWVSASNTTSASCSSSAGSVNCADGSGSAPSAGSNFLIYWDADESRELTGGTSITKSGSGTLLNASGTAACNGTKSTPNLTADILGDWREELILHTTDNKALRIYTTMDVTKRRIYTLMHDPTYRMQVSFEQSSYNQPPHVGFHIGAGMADPPKPDIHVK